MSEKTKDKDEVIEKLMGENKRLNKKIKMQDHIIDTQQSIINTLVELVGMINDKE